MGNEIKWTPAQYDAIHARGSTLLVSAAAGSGKTAVLTNRIIEKIINDKCEITDFLVVTFTRAAASEMKNKIIRVLREKINENPSDKHLRRQLSRIGEAKISTIDSFCMALVKENFNTLGLPAKIRIMDESESKVFLRRKVEEVLEKFYAMYDGKPDSPFHITVETLSGDRDDEKMIEVLSGIYKFINAFPQPIKLLESLNSRFGKEIEKHYEKNTGVFDTSWGSFLKSQTILRLENLRTVLEDMLDICQRDEVLSEKYAPCAENDLEYLERTIHLAKSGSYRELRSRLTEYTPMTLGRANKCENEEAKNRAKELRDTFKKAIAQLQKDYYFFDEESVFSQCVRSYKMSSVIVDMMRELINSDREEKISRSAMDFSDLSHMTFEALVKDGTFDYETGSFEKTPLAQKITSEFTEIFIDEYQDTNLLQDTVFNAISNGKNLFMVGDIKQSIYRFRGADPYIFRKYKDTFEEFSAASSAEKEKIFLMDNFRSNGGVLDFVNLLFGEIMNVISPGSYMGEDMLRCTKPEDKIIPELHIFDKKAEESEDEDAAVGSDAEWEFIAGSIQKLCSEKYTYGDVAVLARDSKELLKIKFVLDSHGIPCTAENRESLFDRPEILMMLCLLNTVDNPHRDIYLIGAMTSPFFGFSSDELYSIRIYAKANELVGATTDCFYSALTYYADNVTNALSEKITRFLATFEAWREYSTETGVPELIRRIMNDISALSVMNDPIQRENLLTFYDFAKGFEAKDLKGLFMFLSYINDIIENGHSVNVPQRSGNNVKLMTMHKSKGLEFPVCFVSALSKKMNMRDLSENIIVNKEMGIALKHSDTSGIVTYDTLHRKVAALWDKNRQYEEEMRLLYVALTRAKERLILTASLSPAKISTASSVNTSFDIMRAVTIYDFIGAVLRADPSYEGISYGQTIYSPKLGINVTLHECVSISEDSYVEKESYCRDVQCVSPEDLAFDYPSVRLSHIPQKLSVSQLHLGLSDDVAEQETVIACEAPFFLSGQKQGQAAAIGTAMHTFVQFCDYAICEKKGCRYEAERLLREVFITKEQYEMLDFKKLDALFDSELYLRMKSSSDLRREMRFNVLVDGERFSSEASGEKILIQGVIDCFFKNADGTYTVVDFKTDRVRSDEILIQRHRTQLDFYADAVSDMTGCPVKEKIIYSFEMSKEIRID